MQVCMREWAQKVLVRKHKNIIIYGPEIEQYIMWITYHFWPENQALLANDPVDIFSHKMSKKARRGKDAWKKAGFGAPGQVLVPYRFPRRARRARLRVSPCALSLRSNHARSGLKTRSMPQNLPLVSQKILAPALFAGFFQDSLFEHGYEFPLQGLLARS